ncbi:carboxypeptidase-like regulatory domain-containing protein [Microtetraspora malaysiensis]|uniref:carboxypeptidase-like regulatory domain-containing protein n=1 Tax=Microtetraspora malaysiensis TaxID=161358 RepID=UPI003D8AA290
MRRLLAAGVLLLTMGGCGVVDVTGDFTAGSDDTGGSSQGTRTDDRGSASMDGVGTAARRDGGVEPGVLKGRVVDANGRPIQGALIVADNQMVYNSNLMAPTDADGYYRIQTPGPFTFHATGQVTRQMNGQEFATDLMPDDDNPFAGPSGAIRNFTLKLDGKKPGGQGHVGGMVIFYLNSTDPNDPDSFLQDEGVTLTLRPEGPLLDGSAGETITRKAERGGDGSGLYGVPIARYRISADYQGRPLRVKAQGGSDFAASVVADFRTVMSGIYRIDLELSL